MIRNAFVCLLLLIAGTPLVGQCPADSAKLDDASAKTVFGPMAETIFNVLHPVGHPVSQDSLEQALKTTVPFVESWAVTRSNSRLSSRLVDLELSRWDKQTSSGSDASGSTSITSKGSVASLFSFAVENGALTRSVSGTTLTFRTSPANVIAAIRKGGWIDAGPSVPAFDGSFESIAKRFSFFVAFDASRGNSGAGGNNGGGSGSSTVFTGDKQQLAGWGSRFEIINHRDPRDPKYSAAFQTLMQRAGVRVADRLNRAKIAQVKGFDAITQKLQTSINTHPDDESAILDDYKTADGAFRKSVCDAADSQPDAYREINGAADDVASFLVQEADLFNDIARSFTLAVEYNLTRQANTNGSLPPS